MIEELIKAIEAANVRGRVLRVRGHKDTGQVFVNFYNLPKDVALINRGGGAEAENNRCMLTLECRRDGKVKVEHAVNTFGRERRLRGKTATPEKAATYVVAYLEKLAAEVEPRLTHENLKLNFPVGG
jgi:hypothetical protein